MQDLHHSDIVSYALTRVANEYAKNREALVDDLQRCIREHNHRGLGTAKPIPLEDGAPECSPAKAEAVLERAAPVEGRG